jgi:hypothetical protein
MQRAERRLSRDRRRKEKKRKDKERRQRRERMSGESDQAGSHEVHGQLTVICVPPNVVQRESR